MRVINIVAQLIRASIPGARDDLSGIFTSQAPTASRFSLELTLIYDNRFTGFTNTNTHNWIYALWYILRFRENLIQREKRRREERERREPPSRATEAQFRGRGARRTVAKSKMGRRREFLKGPVRFVDSR